MVQDHKIRQGGVGDSKFSMVRCLIAMAHADGNVSSDEWSYLTDMIARLPLSARQKAIIAADLDRPENVESLLRSLESPARRSEVIYFARLLAYKDGAYEPSEEDILTRLERHATENLDMEAVRADVRKHLETELALHDAKTGADRPSKGLFWAVDKMFRKLGIDLMD